MKLRPYYLILLLGLFSCENADGRPNPYMFKLLALAIVVPITYLIKYLREKNREKEIYVPQQTETIEVTSQEEESTPVSEAVDLESVHHFKRSKITHAMVLLPILGLLVCFANVLAGILVFVVLVIVAIIAANKENDDNWERYSDVSLYADRIVLAKPSSFEDEEIPYSSIHRITVRDDYNSGAYGMQVRRATELVLWNKENRIITSIDYTKFGESEELKNLLFAKLKVKQTNV